MTHRWRVVRNKLLSEKDIEWLAPPRRRVRCGSGWPEFVSAGACAATSAAFVIVGQRAFGALFAATAVFWVVAAWFWRNRC